MNLTFIFSDSDQKFSLVLLQIWLITSLALEKREKERNTLYIILVQGFCPLKIEITQFPPGFCLKVTRNPNVKSLVFIYWISQVYIHTYIFTCLILLVKK